MNDFWFGVLTAVTFFSVVALSIGRVEIGGYVVTENQWLRSFLITYMLGTWLLNGLSRMGWIL